MIEPATRAVIGRTALSVSRLGFGSAPLGGLFQSTPQDDAAQAIAAAWTHGLRYFDTAPQYGSGLAERRVGEGLRRYARDDFVLSSKVGKLLRPPGSGVAPGTLFADALPFDVVFDYSFEGAMRSLEESLERMGLDRVDMLLIHDVNRKYHGERVMEMLDAALAGTCKALARLRDEGVIGAFGPALNDVDVALRFANEGGIDCVMLPARYTLLDQSAATALLPACAASGFRCWWQALSIPAFWRPARYPAHAITTRRRPRQFSIASGASPRSAALSAFRWGRPHCSFRSRILPWPAWSRACAQPAKSRRTSTSCALKFRTNSGTRCSVATCSWTRPRFHNDRRTTP